ncbi:iron transporter FeoA [Bergeyella porcorum]|uniref:Iron transporter FeoA n=1 Tax=Bergeyella porcorum TaxID=1735111 RepID=A0AAU0F1P2_9FLAO
MKKNNTDKLSGFPLNQLGEIVAYDDEQLAMPQKIIEMGLLPRLLSKFFTKHHLEGLCI